MADAHKALEAALDAFYGADAGDSGLEPHVRELCDMKRAIITYFIAFVGRGEIAKMHGRHIVREHELQAMQTQAFPLLLQNDKAHADRAVLLNLFTAALEQSSGPR